MYYCVSFIKKLNGATFDVKAAPLCGQRWIRTTEGVSQQIYSLPHLATLVFARYCCLQPLFLNCDAKVDIILIRTKCFCVFFQKKFVFVVKLFFEEGERYCKKVFLVLYVYNV